MLAACFGDVHNGSVGDLGTVAVRGVVKIKAFEGSTGVLWAAINAVEAETRRILFREGKLLKVMRLKLTLALGNLPQRLP